MSCEKNQPRRFQAPQQINVARGQQYDDNDDNTYEIENVDGTQQDSSTSKCGIKNLSGNVNNMKEYYYQPLQGFRSNNTRSNQDDNGTSADLNGNRMASAIVQQTDDDNSNGFMDVHRRRTTLPPASRDSLEQGAKVEAHRRSETNQSSSNNNNNNNDTRSQTNTSETKTPFLHSPPADGAKAKSRVGRDDNDDDAQGEHAVNSPNRQQQQQQEENQTASTYRVPVVDRSLFRSAFVASVAPVAGAYLEQISTNVIRNVCRKLLQVSVKPLFTGGIDSPPRGNSKEMNKKDNQVPPLSIHHKPAKTSRPAQDQSPCEEATQPPKRHVVSSVRSNNNSNTLHAVLMGKVQSEIKNHVSAAASNKHSNGKNNNIVESASVIHQRQQQNRIFFKVTTSASALRLNSTAERLARVLSMIPQNWILVIAAASTVATTAQSKDQQLLPSGNDNLESKNINHTNGASVLLASVQPDSNSVVVIKEEPVIEAKILTVATSTPNTSTSQSFAPRDGDLPTTATCRLAGLRDLLKARSLRFLNSNENGRKDSKSCGSMIASVVSLPGLPLLPLVDEFSASCNDGKSNKISPQEVDSTKQQQQQEQQQQLKRPNNATTLAVDDIHLKEFVELGSPSGLTSFLGASPSVFDLTDAAMKDYLHTARYPGSFKPVATLGAGAFGTAYLVVYKENQDVIERQAKDLEFRASHAITEEFYLRSTVFSSPKQQQQQVSQRLQHINSLSQKNATEMIFGSLNSKAVGQSFGGDELVTNSIFTAGAAAVQFESGGSENKASEINGPDRSNNDKCDEKRFVYFLNDAPANQQERRIESNLSFLVDQHGESAVCTTGATNAAASQMPSFIDLPVPMYRFDHLSNNNNNLLPIISIPRSRGRVVRNSQCSPLVRPPQFPTTVTNQSKQLELLNNSNNINTSPPRVVFENANVVASNGETNKVNLVGKISPSPLHSGSGGRNNSSNNNNRREVQHPRWKIRNPLTKKSIVPVGGPAGCGSGMSCTTLNVTVTMTKKTPASGAATSSPTRQSSNTNNNNSNNISHVLTIPREQIFVCKVEKLPDAQGLKKRKKAADIKAKMPWDSDIHIDPGENDDDDDDGKNKKKNPSPSAAAENAKKRLERMRNEAHILSSIAHPNIVGYVDYFFDKKANRQLLFLEYVDGGDLEKEIERRRKTVPKLYFSFETVLHIFVQVLLAVEYLHRHNILHRDIKSQNILISKLLFVKLTDFGTARQFDQDVDQNVDCGIAGTPLFMCAARLNGEYYSQKSEMWSLGVLLYELLSFEYPFMSNDIKQLMAMIENAEPRPLRREGEHVPIELFRVLESLLQKNPDDRPTAKEVLTQHPIIAKAVRGYENRLQKFTESFDVSTPADRAWLGVLRDHIRVVYEDYPISMSSQQSRADDSAIRGDLSRMRSGGGVFGGSNALGGNLVSFSRGESNRQQRCQTSLRSTEHQSVITSGKFLFPKSNHDRALHSNEAIRENEGSNYQSNGELAALTSRRPIMMQVLQPELSSEFACGDIIPSPQSNFNNNMNNADTATGIVRMANMQSPPVSSSPVRRVVSLIVARRGNDDDDAANVQE